MIERLSKENNISAEGISIEKKTIYGEFNTHWHDFTEIEFFINGSGKYVIDGKTHEIKKNMLFFMTPINFHRVSIDENAEMVNIMFSENICNNTALFMLASGMKENSVTFSDEEATFVKSVLFELISAVKNKDKAYYSALLDVLLLKTVNRTKKSIPNLTYVQSAMLYILNNFRSDISLADAAQYVGLSPAYLSSVFSKESGIRFKEYLNSVRFDYARKMLTYSDMNISEICFESGFDDYANFIRSFKNRFGSSPGRFRKNVKNAAEKQ